MDRTDIICNYSKSDFINFIESDNSGKILKLLNNEGISILDSYKYKYERLEYIMCYSKYRNEIFKNDRIADITLSKIDRFYALIITLDFDTCMYLFNRSIAQGYDTASLFTYFKLEYKKDILNNWKYPNDLLYSILKMDRTVVKQEIINKFDIDLSKIDLISFFDASKRESLSSKSENNTTDLELNIPSRLITEKVKEKIWGYNDIFVIRQLINDASYVMDINDLNEYIKSKEMKCIKSSGNNLFMEPFNSIYNYFYKFDIAHDDDKYDIQKEFYNFVNNNNLFDIYSNIRFIYRDNGIDGVYNYLRILNNRYISNYIIDYYFEDIYHNVILNMNELLRFYFDGNINIPMDRLSIYERISNIDSLSMDEKIDLCNELDDINVMELFYDDMLKAREIVANSIKDSSITLDTISSYKNTDLSNKYGIDIYTNDNDYFFGIVKTSTNRYLYDINPTGHSFSLVGDNNPKVFSGDKTYLYDASDFNPEQLVHVYPSDSFTLYRPFSFSTEATTRVNNLLNSQELIDSSIGYNEILILEQGTKSNEMDNRIPKLKPIALYCIDEITEKDIENAKKEGLGIFLAKTKSKDNIRPLNNYRGEIDYWNYDYYNSMYRENFEEKRVK